MEKKQGDIANQAEKLRQKMDELSGEVPLFGGEPRGSLDASRNEMGQARSKLADGQLPGATRHQRLAAEHLSKLRQSLEQASKGKGGGRGLPMPLGGSMARGGHGNGGMMGHERVEIPQSDRDRADLRFRKELLEAAKQKAPVHYEDAVRKYYEELIR